MVDVNRTIPCNIWIDLVRMFTVLLAGGLVVYTFSLLLHWRSLPFDFARKLRYVSLFGYGLLTAAQEAEQLGKPFLLWRLPLLLLCTSTALLGNLLPDLQGIRKRRLPPVPHYEWPLPDKDE